MINPFRILCDKSFQNIIQASWKKMNRILNRFKRGQPVYRTISPSSKTIITQLNLRHPRGWTKYHPYCTIDGACASRIRPTPLKYQNVCIVKKLRCLAHQHAQRTGIKLRRGIDQRVVLISTLPVIHFELTLWSCTFIPLL